MAIRWKTTDSHDAIRYTALDAHKQPVNLIGATARFLMGKRGDADSVIINEPAQVADEMAGKLAYELTEIATLEAGTFNAEFHVEWPDGSRKIFPSEGYLAVTVAPSLDVSKVGEVEERIILRVSQIEEFKDEIVAEVDGFRATVGQAEDAAVEAEVQADYAKAQGDRAKTEADRLEGTDVSVLDNKVNDVDSRLTAQLAEKAQQTELEATGKRIDELIIGSGNANAEVTDAHVSTAKNKTFTTVRNRFEEIERDTNLLMENKVVNGDFNVNSVGWYTSGSTHAAVSGKLKVTGSGSANYSGAMQNTGIPLVVGEKWFVKMLVEPTQTLPSNIRLIARGNTQVTIGTNADLTLNQPHAISAIYSAVDTTALTFGVQAIYADAATATGAVYTVDKVVLINLTAAFGAGFEPTEKELNELLTKFDSSYFEGNASAVDYKRVYSDMKVLQEKSGNVDEVKEIVTNQVRRNQITTRTPFEFTVSSSYTSQKRRIWTITYDDEAKNIYQYGLPVHQAEEVPGVFYVIPNRIGTGNTYNYGVAMNWDELLSIKDAGWEIGHHTVDHLNTSYMDKETLMKNIEDGNEIFMQRGIFPRHFSHPGGANSYSNSNVLKEYFDSAALTVNDVNGFNLNPWRLNRKSADSWYNAIYNAITELSNQPDGWLISYHHAIHPDGTVTGASGPMACWTPTQLQTAIQYAKSSGIEVVSMDEGLRTYAPYLYYFDEVNDPAFSVQRNGIIKNATPIATQ